MAHIIELKSPELQAEGPEPPRAPTPQHQYVAYPFPKQEGEYTSVEYNDVNDGPPCACTRAYLYTHV